MVTRAVTAVATKVAVVVAVAMEAVVAVAHGRSQSHMDECLRHPPALLVLLYVEFLEHVWAQKEH